jgi:antitoxin (DNA-binding transcriptional repressor) of toxin-antitoxin stability system
MARLVPIRPTAAGRVPGSARGKFKVPPEFFDPLPDDIIDCFEKETIK